MAVGSLHHFGLLSVLRTAAVVALVGSCSALLLASSATEQQEQQWRQQAVSRTADQQAELSRASHAANAAKFPCAKAAAAAAAEADLQSLLNKAAKDQALSASEGASCSFILEKHP